MDRLSEFSFLLVACGAGGSGIKGLNSTTDPGILTAPLAVGLSTERRPGYGLWAEEVLVLIRQGRWPPSKPPCNPGRLLGCWGYAYKRRPCCVAHVTFLPSRANPNQIRIILFSHLIDGIYVGYTCNVYIAPCALRSSVEKVRSISRTREWIWYHRGRSCGRP